ncbi:MAG: Lipid A export ATP-binding/permease protein MsbA [Chlamydiia bacterium]|nr:Lipid A export ATP-binding/permease protein MsbA [Chlamydiia bacterium]MCH9617990.1 Lipid A export ATP-binding/permease protein MsbA [Chlamydiia bacterium]MCH9623685.1 Lipid A export ATP-binding/permease protein MsbA [Chlamydiia bacterium]
MKILFAALMRVKNHALLFIFSLFALLGLTTFNFLEIMMFGAIAKSGNQLIGAKDGKIAEIVTSIQDFIGLDVDSFSTLTIAFVIVGLFNAIFLFLSKFLTKILAVRICRDLRNACFAHLQKLPLCFFTKYDRGKLSTRVITDANQIALSFNSFVTNYLHMPFIVVCTLTICMTLSWKLTLGLFTCVPIIVFPLRMITRKIRQISHAMQRRQESFASVIIDHLSGIATIKSFQLEEYSIRKYQEENARMVAYDEKIQKYDVMSRPITHFTMTLMLLCILYAGMHLLQMSFPDIVVYCGVLHKLYGPFKQFSEENANVQKGVVAAMRIDDVMNEKGEGGEEIQEIAPPLIDSFSFKQVSFSYGTEKVLRDISFCLKKGEVLAITGSTGSGKSTLLKLFSRLYEIEKGKIFLDGTDISTISLASLREKFSIVSQEPFFFNDTIRANLIFDKEVCDQEIVVAAKKACIHDFIMNLENGYETVVEEMGKNLSGGQKQRLSIARALIRGSSILLLDEATSSLDAVSEQMISKALSNMKGEITQVIVAHRLSTIQHADKILFLEHGEVKAFGTLPEVMQSAPGFSAMWEASKLQDTASV